MRKKMHTNNLSLIGILFLLLLIPKPTVLAETDCNTPVFVTQAENTLSLYGLNASQELEYIWTLPPEFQPFRYPIVGEPTGGIPSNFHVRYSQDSEPTDDIRFIPHVNDIVPSHDGCHIAFITARYPMRGFGERQLFIYSVVSGDLQQINLDVQMGFNAPNLLWSPDSQYLAIAAAIDSLYLYDTTEGEVKFFVNAESYTYFQWIGNESLAFVRNGNIYLRPLDKKINYQLTEFDEYVFLSPCLVYLESAIAAPILCDWWVWREQQSLFG